MAARKTTTIRQRSDRARIRVKRGPLITILVVLAVGLLVVSWNQSRPLPALLDGSHTARWQSVYRSRTPTFANPLASGTITLSPTGLATLNSLILDSPPTRNPLRILLEHLRYWANQQLFPVHIWVRSDVTDSWATYYQRGRYVFVRQANPWHNVVLVSDLTTDEVENLLAPFVLEAEGLDPNAPAEAEIPGEPERRQ